MSVYLKVSPGVVNPKCSKSHIGPKKRNTNLFEATKNIKSYYYYYKPYMKAIQVVKGILAILDCYVNE